MIAPEKLLEAAKALEPQLQEWRRTLHRHPEVGFDLPQTKALVKKALTEMGYHYRGEWFDANVDDAVAVARKCADMYGLVVSDAKDAKRNMDRYYPLHGKQEERMKAERMLDLVEGNIMLSRGMKFSLDDV